MVAPVGQPAPPLNAFMLAQRGVPVVVEYQGRAGGLERVRITEQGQVHGLVSGLVAACGQSERAHWRDRVRLGVVLSQLKAQLRSGRTGSLFAELGVHPGLGRACMLLARRVADERGVIDEQSLAEAVAEYRRRDRGEREEDRRPDASATETLPAMGENAGAPSKQPERGGVDAPTQMGENAGAPSKPPHPGAVLASASLREIERASRAMSGVGGPHGRRDIAHTEKPMREHSAHERNRSLVSSPPVSPGRAETPVRGLGRQGFGERGEAEPSLSRKAGTSLPPGAGERGEDAAPTAEPWRAGPQIRMDELYREAAEHVSERCRRVAGLPVAELVGRLRAMGTDEMKSVIEALASLSGEGARGVTG